MGRLGLGAGAGREEPQRESGVSPEVRVGAALERSIGGMVGGERVLVRAAEGRWMESGARGKRI